VPNHGGQRSQVHAEVLGRMAVNSREINRRVFTPVSHALTALSDIMFSVFHKATSDAMAREDSSVWESLAVPDDEKEQP
jgi:hypothetical protein